MRNSIHKTIVCLLVLIASINIKVFAQDFHLTQYDAAPQYINPALTGMYFNSDADYRINANYRSQWNALVAKPYTTTSAGYDMPYQNFGIGGMLIDNKSGIGFNTFNFLASGAYKVSVGDKHFLSTGLQMGLLYKSFDPDKFTYDSQYSESTGTFDTSIPSGENITQTNVLKFDANVGVFYKYIDDAYMAKPFGGFSIYHITKPNESFTSIKSQLPMRFNFNIGSDVDIDDKISLTPQILYMYQAKATELNIGVLGWYKLNDISRVMLGLNLRSKDAFIIQLGYRQEDHIFRLSYDINTSYLNQFSGGRGAIEFSLILCGKKGKPLFNPKF